MSDDIIRQLEALQDEQEAEIAKRAEEVGNIDDLDIASWDCEPARLLGIAIGLADGYRKAADLLRGGPRPGGLTFKVRELHRGGPGST